MSHIWTTNASAGLDSVDAALVEFTEITFTDLENISGGEGIVIPL